MSTARKAVLNRLAVGTALLAAAAAPLALALPAEAATTANGCTVRPLKPTFAGFSGGVKQIRYEVVFSCAAGRTIEVQQLAMEDDSTPDQFINTRVHTRTFVSSTVATRSATWALPDTEAGNEEVYQKVRFRVSAGGGPVSAWTPFEFGPTLSIAS